MERSGLKEYLQSELNLPRRAHDGRNRSGVARWKTGAGERAGRWNSEISVVKDIEKLGSELCVNSLHYSGVFCEREIRCDETGCGSD